MDRAKAFDVFRKSYRKNEALEENRQLLKEKYALGKKLGESVNITRTQIKTLTNKIEEMRKENALRGMVDPETGEIMKTSEEDQIQRQINEYKIKYQEQYTELKKLKKEIENIQHHLERCRERLQKDFESWITVMI